MAIEQRDGRFDGEGGIEIFWQSWSEAPAVTSAARAAVVVAHGVSEHSGRYAHLAAKLAAAGYPTYALDHRGHGQSGGDRVVIDRFANVIADLDRFVTLVVEQQPGLPIYLIGHSMGGGIAIGYTLEHESRLAGLLLSAPLASAAAANAVQRAIASLLSRVVPKLGVFPVDAGAVSRDPDVVQAYEDDPLVDRRKLPARTVAELTSNVATFANRVGSLTLPVLLMHGTEDTLVPFDGSEALFEALGSPDKTFERYPGLYHEIFNEPEQDDVIDDVVRWLDAHAAAVRV
jgi:acylglycerol lipase